MQEQKPNVIILSIYQDSLPTIKMVTEAGILGKIGFNSAGVGVCFNAIRAKGLDTSRMPVHLGLRTVLESSSARDAIEKLEAAGMAASAHMLIGDRTGDATGLEFTSSTFAKLPVNQGGQIVHSNHLLAKHAGFRGPVGGTWSEDSPARVEQMTALVEGIGPKQPTWGDFSRVFEDQKGYPAAICRAQEGVSTSATLFNIVMDLKACKGVVKMGRPCDVEEVIGLSFE
jgi:isopenicillin-N N-acyltransferase-like protein